MNVLPNSIYNSTNTTLLNAVYAASQNYLDYPQFGTINYIGNYGHSTYHALNMRVEKRFNNGISYNFLFTWSKNLSGTAGTGQQWYDWNLTKGPTTNDLKYQFVSQATYDLPFGKGRAPPVPERAGRVVLPRRVAGRLDRHHHSEPPHRSAGDVHHGRQPLQVSAR